MAEVIPIDQAARSLPWYRHRWPWLLMLGPFLVVVAGSYTMWLAYTRQDALVVGDYYKQGKAINQDLRRDRVATALNLAVALRYDPVQATLMGRLDSPVKAQPGRLLLHLAHATQPEKDVQLVVQPDADGAFTVALPMLERSRWQVQVESEKRDWRLDGVWSWPAEREIQLRADTASNAPAE